VRDLLQLKKSNPAEHKRLLQTVRLVAREEQVHNSDRVVRGRRHPQIFEMKAPKGMTRLFYFYDHSARIVVCTNCFQKSKNKDLVQDEAFVKANELRMAYMAM